MGSKNGKYLQNGKLFGGAPENKKCLELNFTPENTSKTSKSDHRQIFGHTWAGLTQVFCQLYCLVQFNSPQSSVVSNIFIIKYLIPSCGGPE